MKTISLWQPWASLIAIGAKQYETRSWSTPYRGLLAIHAAKRWTVEEFAATVDFKYRFGCTTADCLEYWPDEPLPTQRTVAHQALVEVDDILPECGFRMLEPEELKLGMSFPASYTILGNKRDQVRQIGNAVACHVAQWIAERCVESLR